MEILKQTHNLELRLKCDRFGHTIVSDQYTAHPLRLSRTFRLDTGDRNRAYIYIVNVSPGLLAGDQLSISLQLAAGTSLYLTDQAATKIHPMPIASTIAKTQYEIEVGEAATLEFVPEPLILFTDAALEQTTRIKLHSTGRLFLSEIILPGRLARGEFYQFRRYFSRLQVTSFAGELWFSDAMHLEGKLNEFKHSKLFASMPVLANLIVVLPQVDLKLLSQSLEDIKAANCPDMLVASSILPYDKGLLIRALATKTRILKNYIKYALNCVRRFSHQPPLPYIPK